MNKLCVIGLAILLSACATITLEKSPVLSPFSDGTQWIVWEDMEFVIRLDDNSVTSIRVPRGFVSDLASTPKMLWSIYPPSGKYLNASVLHDYLYWRRICKKDEADKIFYQAMHDVGVDQATQSRFYVALYKEGQDAWDANKIEQARGLVRVIPEEFLVPKKANRSAATSWSEFRGFLQKRNVREKKQPSDDGIPKACEALAREITVKTGLVSLALGK